MKIGLYFSKLNNNDGGVYTFERDIFNALSQVPTSHELVVIDNNKLPQIGADHIKHFYVENCPGAGNKKNFLKKILEGLGADPEKKVLCQPEVQKIVEDYKIDLMWFLGGLVDVDIPYVFTVVDLQHRIQPSFPGVSPYGWKWDTWEEVYVSGLKKCAFCVCGTKDSKKEVEALYAVSSNRIKTIPIPTPTFALEASSSNIRSALPDGITQPYLFYPAQFCPHKNHVVLLLALKILREQHGLNFSLVFCGQDKGNLNYVKQQVSSLGLTESVKFLGFVNQVDMVTLYQHAFAVPYPSVYSTNNLPPLEAFALACPVIASNVSGAEEQLGEAALLVDPLDESSIAQAIKKLWDEPGLRQKLIEKGRLQGHAFTARDYVKSIFTLADEFMKIRRCWK
jgi:glycosyltransferase involved in cell wall biosynthesis